MDNVMNITEEMSVHIGPKTGCILLWEELPQYCGRYGGVNMYTTNVRDGFTIEFRGYDVNPLLKKIKEIKDRNLHFPFNNHIDNLEEDIKREVKFRLNEEMDAGYGI
jgi:hypothetical protein|tara:strand:+ start:170 stop:490 length:321 start_codon:yes stop_codon:yes gene_type:complete